ncbi:MAG TPA: hypothetical protein VHK69_18400, partial [Chitinophagaceae bacterium]|nr:hypothetical protein [Chitinophagaceae bacterium]
MLQKLSVVFFGLVTFMMLARMYTPAVYGVWGLFMIISSIVETARASLIRNAYVLFINKNEEKDHPAVEAAALLSNCVLTGLLILFFFFSRHWL